MPNLPPEIERIAQENQAALQGLDKASRKALRKRFAQAAERLEAKLEQFDKDSFQAQQARIQQLLARAIADETGKELREVLEAAAADASALAGYDVEQELQAWWDHYGHEARPPNLQAIAQLDKEILVERFERSLERWGQVAANRMKTELAVGLAEKATRQSMTDAIHRAVGGERWQALRIVRTEVSETYNASHHKTLTHARDSGIQPNLQKTCILVKDERTDEDSLPLEGQVRDLEENFVDGDGREYLHPPGRPNDREKEVPYVPEDAPAPQPDAGDAQPEEDEGAAEEPRDILETDRGQRARSYAQEEFGKDIADITPGSTEEKDLVRALQEKHPFFEAGDTHFEECHNALSVLADRRFQPSISEGDLFDLLDETVAEVEERIGAISWTPEKLLDELDVDDLNLETAKVGDLLPKHVERDGLDPSLTLADLDEDTRESMVMAIEVRRNDKLEELGMNFVQKFQHGLYADTNVPLYREGIWQQYLDDLRAGEMPVEIGAPSKSIREAMSGILEELRENGGKGLPVELRRMQAGAKGATEELFEKAGKDADSFAEMFDPSLRERLGDKGILVFQEGQRPSFNRSTMSWNLGDGTKQSTFHELGHWLEQVDGVVDAETQFYARRMRGHRAKVYKKHVDAGDEIGVKDDFIDLYVGKAYFDKGSRSGRYLRRGELPDAYLLFENMDAGEAVSMGTERFSSTRDMAILWKEDPEHFAFALNVLRGSF